MKRYQSIEPLKVSSLGDYVLATDYEALLELAIRLRKGIANTDDITLLLELVDSAWLKE